MDLELVTVGTELMLGFTLDSNAADIGAILASEGVGVARRTTVHDRDDEIGAAVAEALARTGLVIVTGGLGPTQDDITKRAVAKLYEAPLELDVEYLEVLKQRFARAGWPELPESNRTQAEVPRGAEMLPNERGTAPGLWLEGRRGTTVLLPGIPAEMRGILEQQVVPRLRARLDQAGAGRHVTQSLILRTTGISESKLADLIRGIEVNLDRVSLAFLPGLDGTDLRLTVWSMAPEQAVERLGAAVEHVRPVLGENLYAQGDVELAEVLIGLLRTERYRLAVAESCTGGTIAGKITAIPGSSDVFDGGVVGYSNESKVRDLGVAEDVLATHGAVSGEVAGAMVDGVCERFGTRAGIAATGIAGPGGGTPDKPVGTVCLAARAGNRVRSVRRWFPGDRLEVRWRAAQAALDLLRRMLIGGQ